MAREKRTREYAEYAGFVRRSIRAMGRRAALGLDQDDDLGVLAALADEVDAALVVAVAGLRANGYSWQVIADSLGITRQTAHQRFAGRIAAVEVAS